VREKTRHSKIEPVYTVMSARVMTMSVRANVKIRPGRGPDLTILGREGADNARAFNVCVRGVGEVRCGGAGGATVRERSRMGDFWDGSGNRSGGKRRKSGELEL